MARQGVAYNNNNTANREKELIGKWDWNENEWKILIESLKINNRLRKKGKWKIGNCFSFVIANIET